MGSSCLWQVQVVYLLVFQYVNVAGFLDLKKAFDNVKSTKMFQVLKESGTKYRDKRLIIQMCKIEMLEDPGWKIIGGMEAAEGAFPYQVSLRYKENHFCGGSIIEQLWILTAAHCVVGMKAENMSIVVGTNALDSGGEKYLVEKIIAHSRYSDSDILNDIALIKLRSTVSYNSNVEPVKLPKEVVKNDADLILSGWGKSKYPGFLPNKLQMIKLKSICNSECARQHNKMIITDKQICTLTKKGEGACHGDSGGPLVDGDTQVGIVSWGKPCARGKPDVFTRVYSYLDWINENMH